MINSVTPDNGVEGDLITIQASLTENPCKNYNLKIFFKRILNLKYFLMKSICFDWRYRVWYSTDNWEWN